MRVGAALGLVVASVLAAWSSAAVGRTYRATCTDSVYQAPPSQPPATGYALRLGPVVFNHLAPVRDINRPTKGFPYYLVSSFFNVMTSAPRGVKITVADRTGALALSYGNAVSKPVDFLARLRARRETLAAGARSVVFPLCRDATTHTRLITQYGLGVLLGKPGCFTITVQPVRSRSRYSATVRVLVPRC